MATIAELGVDIGSSFDASGFARAGSAVSNLANVAQSAGSKISNALSKGLDSAVSSVNKFGQSFSIAASSIKVSADGIKSAGEGLSKYLSAPLALLGVTSVKTAGDTEALKLGLEAVTGSAAAAGKRFKELQELAKLPGIGLEQAVGADISLQATGVVAKQSAKSIKEFGNAIASVGRGPAELKQALYGVQQLAATDFPMAEDINIIKEAVPQVSKLLKEAFGTARSEELQKLGVSSQEALSTILNGLSELPRVAGGINNTFTNFFDGIKSNLSAFGESLYKNLNIQGLATQFGAAFDNITKSFTNLSPAGQTAILAFAGLAAAAGPVLLAIGGIVSALPVLAAGFAVVTGPIGLAAAAIAGAAYLIISNWDAVTAYFKSSGLSQVLSNLASSVAGTFNALVGYVRDFANLVEPIWDGIVGIFGSGLGEGLKLAGTILSGAFNTFTRILQTFGAIFRGDWAAVFNGVGNITVSIFNGITKILTGFAAGAIRIVGSIAKAVGNTSLAGSFDRGAAAVDKFGQGLQLAYYGAEQVAGSVKKVASAVVAVPPMPDLVQNFSRTPKEAKGKAPKQEKQDLAEMMFGTVPDVLKQVGAYITAIRSAVQVGGTQLAATGGDVFQFLKTPPAYEIPVALTMPKNVAAEFEAVKAQVQAGMTNLNDIVIETTSVMQSSLAGAFESVGNIIADAFTGDLGGAKGFFSALLGIVADFAGNFGKALIAAGVAALAFKNLLANPFAAIAAGVALIAAAGVVKNIMAKGPGKSGASGGGGTGGPRPGYQSPAASSPAYNQPGSAVSNSVEFKIRGTELVGVLRQTSFNAERTG